MEGRGGSNIACAPSAAAVVSRSGTSLRPRTEIE